MESHPALDAILTGITEPAERERIARAFHSLSQGDELSFPVVFALVANGAALSVAQSAAVIKDCLDRFPTHGGDHRAQPAPSPRSLKNRSRAGLFSVGVLTSFLSACAGVGGGFLYFKLRFEAETKALKSQFSQTAALVEALGTAGGELRFQAARDDAGEKVRTLILDGGTHPPRDAFLNISGQAVVVLEPLPGDSP